MRTGWIRGRGPRWGWGSVRKKAEMLDVLRAGVALPPQLLSPPPPSAGVARERQHTWVAFLGHGGSWVSHQGRRTRRDAGATRNHILRPAHNLLLT